MNIQKKTTENYHQESEEQVTTDELVIRAGIYARCRKNCLKNLNQLANKAPRKFSPLKEYQ